MILKIKTGNGWVLFDGFNEVNYVHHAAGTQIGARMDVYDYRNCDSIELHSKTATIAAQEEQNKYFSEIWLHRSGVNAGDNSKQILTDNPAYILNDNGKTVETI